MDAFTDLNMPYFHDVHYYLKSSLQIEANLRHEQLWDIVEETDEPPKEENDYCAFMAWSHKNDKVLRLIKYYLRGTPLKLAIEKTTSAKIAWDTLAAVCALHKSKLHRYLYIQTFLA